MKKFTAIIMAADVVFSLAACGTKRQTKEVSVEPIREVVSEQVSTYMEEIKNTTEEITLPTSTLKKIKEKASTTKSCTQYYDISPYVKEYLGKFSLTFYVADEQWGYNTATGVRSQHLQTCAVDPHIIPYGSTILIEGNNNQQLVLKAVDCGGGIIGQKIDVFWDKSISEGYDFFAKFGTIQNVYLLEE